MYKKFIKSIVVLLTFLTVFGMGIGIYWSGGKPVIQLGSGAYAAESTPATVVNQQLDMGGNGGRKLTTLSNGWLVCAGVIPSEGRPVFYVSNSTFPYKKWMFFDKLIHSSI